MDDVEAAGLSPRAVRGIALIGLALAGLAAGAGVYLWSAMPHPYSGPPPPPTSQPVPVSMDWRSATQGWMVVHDAGGPESLLFRTVDGGAHWQRQIAVGGPSAVRFTDARHGTVRIDSFRGGPQVLRTDDGGAHWVTVALPALAPGASTIPFFLDQNAGWLLSAGPGPTGSRSSLYRTADGGRHWRQLPDPPAEIATLTFAGNGTGWATRPTSAAPTLLVTRDGGVGWTAETLPPGGSGPHPGDQLDIAPPVVSPDGRGVLSVNDRDSGQGWVYVSEDGGATWLDPRPLPWSGAEGRPAFAGGGAGWTWNDSSAWVTADSGRTWRPVNGLPAGWSFNSITPVSATTAWATASQAVAQGSLHLLVWGLFHTTDAGQHWARTRLPNLG